jgi:ketosteroid isomerase-like protein
MSGITRRVLLFALIFLPTMILPQASFGNDEKASRLVKQYYSKFQKPNFLVDDLMKFYTDDIKFVDPTFEIVANGKDAVRNLYIDLGTEKTSYQNIEWDIRDIIIQIDSVVIQGKWSGVFHDCIFDVEFMTLWKLRKGLIAEQTDFFAASTFDRQVGWDPSTGKTTCAVQ